MNQLKLLTDNQSVKEIQNYVRNNSVEIKEIKELLIYALQNEMNNGVIEYYIELLKYNLNYYNHQGSIPLFVALSKKNYYIADLLIENKANINFINLEGENVLLYLYQKKILDESLLIYLLKKGIDVNYCQRKTNKTFLDYIDEYRNRNFINIILKYFYNNDVEVVLKLLLSHKNNWSMSNQLLKETIHYHINSNIKSKLMILAYHHNNIDLLKFLFNSSDDNIDFIKKYEHQERFIDYKIYTNELEILLIENGANIDITVPNSYDNQYTELLRICKFTDFEERVKFLVSYGAKVNQKSYYRNEFSDPGTPLIFAIKKESLAIVKYLLNNGADLFKIKDHNKNFALKVALENTLYLKYLSENSNYLNHRYLLLTMIEACANNHIDGVKYFIEHNVDINQRIDCTYGNQVTPLYVACQHHHLSIVNYLIEHGANTDYVYVTTILMEKPITPLTPVATSIIPIPGECKSKEEYIKATTIPITQIDNPCTENENGKNNKIKKDYHDIGTILNYALKSDDKKLSQYLIKHKVGIYDHSHHKVVKNDISLIYKYGGPLMANYILKNKNLRKERDSYGNTIPMIILMNFPPEQISRPINYLISKDGIELNAKNDQGNTLLMLACIKGNIELVEKLIKRNVEINELNNEGNSALMLACQYRSQEIIKLLIKENADINIINNKGQSALHIVCRNNDEAIARLLIVNGADSQQMDWQHWTPLTYAYRNGNINLINYLINKNEEKGKDRMIIDGEENMYEINDNQNNERMKEIYKAQFLYACDNNNLSEIQYILEQSRKNFGIYLLKENYGNNNLIMYAFNHCNKNIFSYIQKFVNEIENDSDNSDSSKKEIYSYVNEIQIKKYIKEISKTIDSSKRRRKGKIFEYLSFEFIKQFIINNPSVSLFDLSSLIDSFKSLLLEITYQYMNHLLNSSSIENIAKALYNIISNNTNPNINSTNIMTDSNNSDYDNILKLMDKFYQKYGFSLKPPPFSSLSSSSSSSSSLSLSSLSPISTLSPNSNLSPSSTLPLSSSSSSTLSPSSSLYSSSSSSSSTLSLRCNNYSHLTVKKAQSLFLKLCQRYLHNKKHKTEDNDMYQLINHLLHQGIDINYKTKYGKTILMMACEYSNIDLVNYLVSHGADINIKSSGKQIKTALTITFKKLEDFIVNYFYSPNQWNQYSSEIKAKFATLFNHSSNYLISLLEEINEIIQPEAKKNDVTIMKILLQHGGHVEDIKEFGISPQSINDWNEAYIYYFIHHNIDINGLSKNGETALIYACQQRNLKLIKYLIQHGANINLQNREGKTVFMLASMKVNKTILNYLIDQHVHVNIQDIHGTTALMYACKRENINMIQYLLKNKAELNIKDRFGKNELMIACLKGNISIVKVLIEYGGNLWEKDHQGNTVLMYACKSENLSLVHYLLSLGLKFNSEEEVNCHFMISVFARACINNSLDMVKFLVEQGMNVNTRFHGQFLKGKTPLMVACDYGHIELVTYLIDVGAEINAQLTTNSITNGKTAYMFAYQSKHYDIAIYLLKHGGELNEEIERSIDINHQTFLSYLCLDQIYLSYIQFLIEMKGASIHSRDGEGNTPFLLACAHGNQEIINYLHGKGSKINEKNDQKESGLQFACSYGKNRIVEYLINHGAEIDNINKQGSTPLMAACYSLRHRPMDWNERDGVLTNIKYLIDCGARIDIQDKDRMTALLHFYRSRIYYNDTLLIRKYLKLTVKKLAVLQNTLDI